MRWTGISIETPTKESEEAVTQLLINAGCGGVALSGEGDARQVTSYLPADDSSSHKLRQLTAALSLLPSIGITDVGAPKISEIDEEDWANSWKAYFKPLRIGKRLVVSPPWEDAKLTNAEILITIDPGMAFGTGTHATTQLCMILLEEFLTDGAHVADIGTGSGILSIVSHKLGAEKVVAVDNDPLAVKIAAENAQVNLSPIAAQDNFPLGTLFDVVVANIIADTIIALAPDLASITRSEGILIVSGIIEGRQDDVRIFVEGAGYTSIDTRQMGEWVALVFRRSSEN